MLKKKNSLLKTLFSVTSIVFLGKALGFVKQIVVAGAYGATIETDLISLAEGLTANIEYVIVQTLITAFVPIYLQAKSRSEAENRKFVSDALKLFPLISAGLVGIIILLAPVLSRIIAPTYTAELSGRLAIYLRIFAPVLLLFTLQAIFHALLNANEKFWPGQLIGCNQSIINIALTVFFGSLWGPNTLAVCFILYPLVNVVSLSIWSRNYWRIEKGLPELSDSLRAMLRMLGPLLLGYAAIFVNQQVDKIIVSGMAPGTVTAMGYGATLSNFVATIIGTVCSVLYTRLSQNVAAGNRREAADFSIRAVERLIFIFLPISIITVVCSKDIVSAVFLRGAFDEEAAIGAGYALAGYAFSFVPTAVKSVFSRLQYGHNNTKWPMINNSIGIGGNILLSLLLYKPLGIFGVTLASSAAELISAVLNVISAKKQAKELQLKRIWCHLPWWLAGGTVCVLLALWGQTQFSGMGAFLRFMLITLLAGGGYALTAAPILFKEFRRKRG